MKLAYIDACVWITLVEGLDRYRPPIRAALATLAEDGWELCSSDAVRLEVLVRPLRMKQGKLVDLYRGLLDMTNGDLLATCVPDPVMPAGEEDHQRGRRAGALGRLLPGAASQAKLDECLSAWNLILTNDGFLMPKAADAL